MTDAGGEHTGNKAKPKKMVSLHGWSISPDKTIVSPVGLGLVVTPKPAANQNIDDLGDILALVKEIALESDLLMPLVAVVEGVDDKDKRKIRRWRRQQVYHQGKFLLLPARDGKSEDSEKDLLKALLNPDAGDIRKFTPPSPLGLQQFWDELTQDERLQKAFARPLAGWKDVSSPVFPSPAKQQEYWQKRWQEMLAGESLRGTAAAERVSGQEAPGEEAARTVERPNSYYTRIKAARIENFKGLKQCPPQDTHDTAMLDLDADIILVTGANGNGKSSFVEALSLALTRYHPAWQTGGGNDHFFFKTGDTQENRNQDIQIRLDLEKRSLDADQARHDGKKTSTTTDADQAEDDMAEDDKAEDDGEEPITITISRQNAEISPDDRLAFLRRETGAEESGTGGREIFVPVNEQLHYRMTTYLPEHVNMLFDENVAPAAADSGQDDDPEQSRCMGLADEIVTIGHLFPVLSPEIEALCRAAEERRGKVKDELDRYKTEIEHLEDFSSQYTEAKEFISRLQEHIRRLPLERARGWQPDPRWQQQPGNVQEFVSLLADERGSLEQLFSGRLVSWLDLGQLIKRAHGKGQGQQETIDRLEQEVRLLVQRERELKGRMEEPETSSPALRQLLECYHFFLEKKDELARELEDWSGWKGPAGSEGASVQVGDLAEAMRQMKTERLQLAENILSSLLGLEQQKLRADLGKIRAKRASRERELEAARKKDADAAAFKQVISFLDVPERQYLLLSLDAFYRQGQKYASLAEEREKLEKEKEDLDALGGFILNMRHKASGTSAGGKEDSFRKALDDTINQVIRRFVFADGMDKVEVTPEFLLKADAGRKEDFQRGVQCLSSGQKAQLAMAWMIASRELAQSPTSRDLIHFPHRILIMDDPSTTFDTTNLLSQAILWRQLAYNPDSARRYQVFIVSHHEEFSSHLLDLLCPPPGHSMRLLRFSDWSRDRGARVEAYDVEPSPLPLEAQGSKKDKDGLANARQAFKDALETLREMV